MSVFYYGIAAQATSRKFFQRIEQSIPSPFMNINENPDRRKLRQPGQFVSSDALNPLENLVREQFRVGNSQINVLSRNRRVFKTPEKARIVRDSPSDFSRVVPAPQSPAHKNFLRHVETDDKNIVPGVFERNDALRVQDDNFPDAIRRFEAFLA